MSEYKAPRPMQTIQQEYQNLALRSGNLQYEISEKSKDLALINTAMRELNFEFIASREADEKEKAAAAAPVASEAEAK